MSKRSITNNNDERLLSLSYLANRKKWAIQERLLEDIEEDITKLF